MLLIKMGALIIINMQEEEKPFTWPLKERRNN